MNAEGTGHGAKCKGALKIELPLYGLNFKREVEMPVRYRNRSL